MSSNEILYKLCSDTGNGAVTRTEFESIAPFVTAVSLMTYDFSHPHRYV